MSKAMVNAERHTEGQAIIVRKERQGDAIIIDRC
jgi:hypothetical protein